MQKEALPSHELQDHDYVQQNLFELMEDNHSQRNWQNQLSHLSLPNTVKEHQESLIQGKIDIQQNSNENLEYW